MQVSSQLVDPLNAPDHQQQQGSGALVVDDDYCCTRFFVPLLYFPFVCFELRSPDPPPPPSPALDSSVPLR